MVFTVPRSPIHSTHTTRSFHAVAKHAMRSAGRSGQLTHAHTGGFSRVHLTGSGPNACCGNVHGAAGISLKIRSRICA